MSNTGSSTKIDCYADGERNAMVQYQSFKQKLLIPLLKPMAALGVTPDQITLVSLLLGIAFVPVYLQNSYTTAIIAYILLALHLIVDGVDGPLARYLGTASSRGSFTDTFADQVVVSVTTIGYMLAAGQQQPGLGIVCGSTYMLLYLTVVALSFARAAVGVPYKFLIRPRNFVYLWFLLATLGIYNPVFVQHGETFVWVCNTILGVQTAMGFWILRKAMPGPPADGAQ